MDFQYSLQIGNNRKIVMQLPEILLFILLVSPQSYSDLLCL